MNYEQYNYEAYESAQNLKLYVQRWIWKHIKQQQFQDFYDFYDIFWTPHSCSRMSLWLCHSPAKPGWRLGLA